MKIKKQGKTLITLVSIAGMATASSSGLISQLTQSLDRAMIPKVQAEESTIRNLQQRAIPVERALARFDAVGMKIKNRRAMLVDERGNYQPLATGVYNYKDLFIIVNDSEFVGYFERGTGQLFDADDDDVGFWECTPPEPDEMPRISSVKDTLQRAQPSLETERPLPGSNLP
ncbi:hypothetical protein FRE64_14000 [Euhalothece natronophila Z-M001]|uniref:Uncharacterized protein n=1 Tax=Euhalothece natronophila Z-M001 TaxID=522448 RepID=A0A5B8NPK6_9CHRO|nr:hypothetical protein [Euhalothece natronophila]QDZ40954.1 hypothetical protein FRE64_14000 [Euhalothece natronophila Z-M001]